MWNANLPRPLYRALALAVQDTPAASALLAALAGEHPVRAGFVAVSPFVLTRGQGHQHFLKDVLAVLPATLTTSKQRAAMDAVGELEHALFHPWQRQPGAARGFRWDPAEDRQHALRFRDPSKEEARREAGATRLGAAGFLSLVSAPEGRRLITRGVVGTGGDLHFVWPLWTVPLTLRAVEVLLEHPFLLAEHPDPRRLGPLGVDEVMRAPRVRAGKYTSVGRAEPMLGLAAGAPATWAR